MVDEKLEDIAHFLGIGTTLEGHNVVQRNKLVMKVTDHQLITGQLYKLGIGGILRRCISQHEMEMIMRDAHEGTA